MLEPEHSTPGRDISEIPTSIPTFSRSVFPLRPMRILCDQTGSIRVPETRNYWSGLSED